VCLGFNLEINQADQTQFAVGTVYVPGSVKVSFNIGFFVSVTINHLYVHRCMYLHI